MQKVRPPVPVSLPPFTLPSYAKINWSLRILGRRQDGYHDIRTVLQTISLHDSLHFAPRGDGKVELSCDNADIPNDERNLVVRAAAALRDRLQIQEGASIVLEKRIPAKGGLGGGSSNAAVALLGLAKLWHVDPSAEVLLDIGGSLGADVPFFLLGGRARGTGMGTKLALLPDTKPQLLLVVAPNATVSTAEAYAALRATALTTTDPASILPGSRVDADFERSGPLSLHNDFEPVIFDIEPEIRRAKQALLRAGARGALLAGSGSSVFGIFDDDETRQRACAKIQAEASWRVFPCVTLSRDEYWRAMDSYCTPLLRSFNLASDTGA